jgi:uncharacterized membrane protein YdjX (TVP38/TMEM64 family)
VGGNGDRRREAGGLSPGRLALVAVLVAGLIGFFAFDLDSWVTFEKLKENREWLLAQVADHYLLTVLAFIGIYATMVAFSVPGALLMSLAGGFLFGQWFGTAWNVIGATIGATALFVIARTALGEPLRHKAGPWMHRLEEGFKENAFSYLLAMRLVPLFPFFVVNLVPAFLGVRLRVFLPTTFFGIIPGGFVYTTAGAGLGTFFESGQTFAMSNILTPEIITALAGLAILSLLPVAYRLVRERRNRTGSP